MQTPIQPGCKEQQSCCPNPGAAAVAVSTLAAAIAQGKTQEELSLLAVIFTQLGDTLATISLMTDCGTSQAVPPVL